MRIDLLLLPGFFTTSVILTLDLLSIANLMIMDQGSSVTAFRPRILSVDGQATPSNNHLMLPAHGTWQRSNGDVVMPFAVGMADGPLIDECLASPAARSLIEHLSRAHKRGATLAASCASTFLLAETGLLDGGRATTSWWLAPVFEERFKAIHIDADSLLTAHNRVLCAGGAMAQTELTLQLIRSHAGPEIARSCARYLLLDEGRASQAPYVIAEHLARRDDVVSASEDWIRDRLHTQIQIEDLAEAVGISTRTLHRRFKAATGMSPVHYVQRQRAEAAATLLRESDLSADVIATRVAYSDEGALRRVFMRHFDCSPRAYRERQKALRSS